MSKSFWLALPVLTLSGLLGGPHASFAQSMAQTPTQLNEVMGATTGLGSSHRFPTAAAASAHCANDTIVWSASPDLIYVLPSAPTYGKGKGFYACKMEADDAGFHAAG